MLPMNQSLIVRQTLSKLVPQGYEVAVTFETNKGLEARLERKDYTKAFVDWTVNTVYLQRVK